MADGDSDLGPAVRNDDAPNRLDRSEAGSLRESAVNSSTKEDGTLSVAWGDYDGDGDLDLAVGNAHAPTRLYRNEGGSLTESAVWSSVEVEATTDVAWGDVDGDGDLDLAVANFNAPIRLYQNRRTDPNHQHAPLTIRPLQATNNPSVVRHSSCDLDWSDPADLNYLDPSRRPPRPAPHRPVFP